MLTKKQLKNVKSNFDIYGPEIINYEFFNWVAVVDSLIDMAEKCIDYQERDENDKKKLQEKLKGLTWE